MKIHDVLAATDRAPYPSCPNAPSTLAVLKGHVIAPGWTTSIAALIGAAALVGWLLFAFERGKA